MENVESLEKRFNSNKWCYSLGGIGRDMTYTLVATFLLIYIQYTMKLTIAQFSTISILLVIGRIWDAINDPIMGTIIENTKSKWGKFKPWILIGAILTAVIVILMFNVRIFTGWAFVIFFAVIYLLWEIAFTMNDISYWSMLPSLSKNAMQRNKITTLAVVFAGVGAFAANAIIALAVGDMVRFYSGVSIGIAFALIACQSLTVFGVKEDQVKQSDKSVSLKEMFRTIKNNDQLLWVTLAMFLYNVGSNLLTGSLAFNMIYLEVEYSGLLTTILVACLGVTNIIIQLLYVKLVKKTGRNKLLLYSLICLSSGYVMLLLLGFTFIPINIVTICICAILSFCGQAILYMILTINLTNTIEYNEYKTKERREAIIFSLRPLMAKFASAIVQLIVTLVLIVSGLYTLSQKVTVLETEKSDFESSYILESKEDQEQYIENIEKRQGIFDEELEQKYREIALLDASDLEKASRTADANREIEKMYEMLEQTEITFDEATGRYTMDITVAANGVFVGGTTSMRLMLRLGVTILPVLFILGAFLVLRKKYIIDEETYERITSAIANSEENVELVEEPVEAVTLDSTEEVGEPIQTVALDPTEEVGEPVEMVALDLTEEVVEDDQEPLEEDTAILDEDEVTEEDGKQTKEQKKRNALKKKQKNQLIKARKKSLKRSKK